MSPSFVKESESLRSLVVRLSGHWLPSRCMQTRKPRGAAEPSTVPFNQQPSCTGIALVSDFEGIS